jgi:uncharacterized SAM-binding protein YcdF (DUF218 family)
MFLFKKIVTLSLMPLALCLGFLGLGVLLLWLRRRPGLAKTFLTTAVLILTALSFNSVASEIVKPLESLYPPLSDTQTVPDIKWVVVLGGGHFSNSEFPPNAQLENQSLSRLVEGVRIHKSVAGSKLVLSGGAVFDPSPEALTMAEVACILGVSRDDIVLESQARDSQEQAEFVKKLVGTAPTVLVTSAIHMPRAMLAFEKAGMNPIPAPVDFSDWIRSENGPQHFFPRARELKKVESALHEYLGLLWIELKSITF